MFTGMVIDELMEMVARAEHHAHEPRMMMAEPEPERDEELLVSQFAYRSTDSQPMMIGVA
jgi:hypothetical protein